MEKNGIKYKRDKALLEHKEQNETKAIYIYRWHHTIVRPGGHPGRNA